MNLAEMRGAYIDDGHGYEAASTRSCQDAFLVVVASSAFADKVTFKSGIVMQQVSGDRRRAKQTGPTCTLALKRSSRTGVTPASFPG